MDGDGARERRGGGGLGMTCVPWEQKEKRKVVGLTSDFAGA